MVKKWFKINNLDKVAAFCVVTGAILNFCLESYQPKNLNQSAGLGSAFVSALSSTLKGFISPAAIVFSASLALQAFLNNRLAEMYNSFHGREMMEARRVVDQWYVPLYNQKKQQLNLKTESDRAEKQGLNQHIKEALDEIYKDLADSEIENKESSENYYNVLKFSMFINEICTAYRAGIVPHKKFLVSFGPNILAYYKILEAFIEHRRGQNKSLAEVSSMLMELVEDNSLQSLLYKDFEVVAKGIKTGKDGKMLARLLNDYSFSKAAKNSE